MAEKKQKTPKRGKSVAKASKAKAQLKKAKPRPEAKPRPKPKPKLKPKPKAKLKPKAKPKPKVPPTPRPKGAARAVRPVAAPSPVETAAKARLERIKESYALLKQFTPKELKLLLNLKRNSSTKAWTLREDLVVLTMPVSNRAIAALLKGRNKEAVKKRLQLLRSKGLAKRVPEPPS